MLKFYNFLLELKVKKWYCHIKLNIQIVLCEINQFDVEYPSFKNDNFSVFTTDIK